MDEPWPLATLYSDLAAVVAGEHDRCVMYAAEDLLLVELVKDDSGRFHYKLKEQGEYLMNLLRDDCEKWNERCEQ